MKGITSGSREKYNKFVLFSYSYDQKHDLRLFCKKIPFLNVVVCKFED